ncbi:MAG: CDC27 family protein [Planctomycetota bacterium]|nr:CDC27 family protein [Planctomycetota bacterium]
MPWKTEIDRIVSKILLDASKGGGGDGSRAVQVVQDLLELAPDRAESGFHVGAAAELLGEAAESLEVGEDGGERWFHLGALDAAARRGERERVQELIDDERFEASLDHPEGRVALRAVGRMLLRDGQDQRVFDYYRRHLEAVDDEGSRRDAEFLLEEALRRADRYERGERNEEEALARLDRAAAFAEDTELEPRAGAKVDRKMGRVHQLAERWDDAAGCYSRALERLPEDDPYRSVLVGDLALATLGVRGTLDLLPLEERERRDEAREILVGEADEGEGRSYNAIYTLGMLHYEDGDYDSAARCLREADQLMRENRAKARIVHARSRFFLGHCLIELGAEGDELDEAIQYIQRDAGPSNLDIEVKEVVFDALLEVAPDVRLPGRRGGRRGGRGRGRDREERKPKPAASSAADHLAAAQEALAEDPLRALEHVDKAFKSRPDFDTWFGAYRTRLEALVGLNEREEALRTYERFRSKLYQRETYDRIEQLLLDQAGPMADLLDDHAYLRELVDLYEVMPDRDDQFVEQCIACAQACLESGEAGHVQCAVAMLQEASARDADAVKELLDEALAAAKEAELDLEMPESATCKSTLAEFEEEPLILLVGGDEGRRPHLEKFRSLAKDLGFEGSWIFTGARPPRKTLEEIEDTAQDSSAILLHHRMESEVRDEVRKMAEEMEIPLRESPWLGVHGLEGEVLRTIRDCVAEDEA